MNTTANRLNIDQAAIHEAGHAVMQWYVGWGGIMENVGVCTANPTTRQLGAMKAPVPNVKHKSSVCRRLLVLYAGHAATKEHFGEELMDIDGDWKAIQFAVGLHFDPRTATPIPEYITSFREEYAEALNQRAKAITVAIAGSEEFMKAVRAVAEALLNQPASDEGWCELAGPDVVKICEETIGLDNRQLNGECKDFMDGNY